MTLSIPDERLARLSWYDPYLEAGDNPDTARRDVAHLRHLYEAALDPVIIGRDPDGSHVLDSHRRVPVRHAGYALHLPYRLNPLPMNKSRHGHWAQEAGQVRLVRETARALTVRKIPPQDRIRVRLDWEVTDKRDRDEDNLVKCMKSLVDGIRLAGVVPKDTRQYVLRDMPNINYAPKSPTRPEAFMRLWIWTLTD